MTDLALGDALRDDQTPKHFRIGSECAWIVPLDKASTLVTSRTMRA